MIRLFLLWAILTGALFGFMYFVERVRKIETAHWTGRIALCGTIIALILGTVVFLERL